MSVLRIRQFGDPVLREQGKQVREFGPSLDRLIQDMIETMNAAPGVGLAATQVGMVLQLFVYESGDGPLVLANPEIIHASGEVVEEEGCLSVPEVRLPVTRYDHLVVRGLDRKGEHVEVELRDLDARIFQHEIDHLNGMLFLDRAAPQDRRKAVRQLNQLAGLL